MRPRHIYMSPIGRRRSWRLSNTITNHKAGAPGHKPFLVSCAVWRWNGRSRSGAPTSDIYIPIGRGRFWRLSNTITNHEAGAGAQDIACPLRGLAIERLNQVLCADITYIYVPDRARAVLAAIEHHCQPRSLCRGHRI